MRCDVIARGIIAAANELELKIPIVVRLQGKISSTIFFLMRNACYQTNVTQLIEMYKLWQDLILGTKSKYLKVRLQS